MSQRPFVGLSNGPARKVARADVGDFALLVEAIHSLPDFINGRRSINVMHLIQINMLHLKALEAGVTGHLNVSGGQTSVVNVIGHRLVHLCCNDSAVAARRILCQPLANDGFCRTHAAVATVLISGIDKIDARIHRAGQNLESLLWRGSGTKIHGTQTKRADF